MILGLHLMHVYRLACLSGSRFQQSRQVSLEESDASRFHVVFRTKLASSSGGGVT